MVSLLLRALNSPGLVLITTFGIAVQTSLFAWWPLNYVQPDIVLLVVIWCAFRRRFAEGGILTLILADLAEIHSGSSAGLLLISYMAIYLGVRLSSKLLVIPDLSAYVITTLFASVAWRLAALGVLMMMGGGAAASQWRHTALQLFPGAVIEGWLGFWVYRWLEKFDDLTFKKPPTEQASLGDPEQIGSADFNPVGQRQFGTARQDEELLTEL